MMKGYIVVNPFKMPTESAHQAERLKEEFNILGVSVEIVSDAYLCGAICGGKVISSLSQADFIIYLDKDKYQSEILSNLGVRLFNTHQAVRLCDDKGTTYIALANKGLNLPDTIFGALCYSKDLEIDAKAVDKIESTFNYPIVVKESFGSMGKGVYLVSDRKELLSVMEKVKVKPHLFQRYYGAKRGVDVRVIVIGQKAICAMERINLTDFRSNVAQGGGGKIIELTDEFRRSAECCAKILGLDYCGVDLLYGDGGEPIVCEVNSNAFFTGMEKTTGFNVAKAYAEYVVKEIQKNT